VGGEHVEQWRGDAVADRRAGDPPLPAARKVAPEQILDQLLRGWIGQSLALIRPILEGDETARLRAGGVQRGEARELAHGALGIERPERRLEDFHRQRAERSRRRFGVAPHVVERRSRPLRVLLKTPRRRERRHALAGDEVRGGDRHRPAEAITDQRDGFGELLQQRQQQGFDVAANTQSAAVLRRAPVEEQNAAPHACQCLGQRDLRIEIEDVRRIDQRRHEHRRRTVAAMIAQAGAGNARDFRLRRRRGSAWRALIGFQPGKRRSRQLGVAFRHLAHELEEQRQRARRSRARAFMLQCTMLR